LGVDRRLGSRSSATLSAGASSAQPRGSADAARSVRATGGAVVTVQERRDNYSLEYQRSIGQLFGARTPVLSTTDILGVGYRHTVRTGFAVDARVQQAWSSDAGIRTFRTRSAEGAFGAVYGLRTGVALSARAFVRRRVGPLTLVGHGVAIGAGYGWSQLRNMPAPVDIDVR
jgi:hypothetical protein